MDRKEHLRKLVDAVIGGNNEQAQVSFHSYLTDAMKSKLNEEDDAETSEDKAEKKEDKAIKDLQDAQEMEKKAEKKEDKDEDEDEK